jgi:thiamine transporter ThiT
MLIFAVLTTACAVYYGLTLDMSMREGFAGSNAILASVIKTFLQFLPFVACGAVQYWKLAQTGAGGSKFWLAVMGTAVGAPIAGIIVMLIVVFALFSKSP